MLYCIVEMEFTYYNLIYSFNYEQKNGIPNKNRKY